MKYLPGALLVTLLLLDLLVGGGGMSMATGAVLWKLRVPRVMTAVIAGGALAASGAQMQAVFRNPLADPHIMGVSGGAGLGAAIATMALGTSAAYFTGFTVAVAAFLGAFVAAGLRGGGAGRRGLGPVPVGDDAAGVRRDAGLHLQRAELGPAVHGG